MIKKINLIKLNKILESDIFGCSIKNMARFTDGEKTFLAFLIYLMGDVESALITKKQLADQTGYCQMSILRFIKKWVKQGKIEKEEKGSGLKISWRNGKPRYH